MSLYKDASLVMIPSAYKDGKLYSIRPTDGSGDFTFSRGSNLAATRVDVNGLIEKGRENLLTYSNDLSNAAWQKRNISVTGNQIGYDGLNNAWEILPDTSYGAHYIFQFNSNSSGITTTSIYAKANGYTHFYMYLNTNTTDRAAWFNLDTGSVGTQANSLIDATITDVGNDWYRCDVKQDIAITSVELYLGGNGESINFTGDGISSILFQDAQLEQGLVATDYIETGASTAQAGILEDMPRLDYSGGASCPSLLLEPSRTNIVNNSEYVTGYFSQASAVVTYNEIVSPEGVQNAFKLTSTTNGQARIEKSRPVGGTDTYTLSVFLKAGNSNYASLANFNRNASVRFNLADGTIQGSGNVVDADIIPIGSDGWYRCYMTMQETSGQTANIYKILVSSDGETYFANNGDYVYAYGAQLELGSYPTSYIPTYGTSQTRSVEQLYTLEDSSLFDLEQGTFFLEMSALEDDGTDRKISISDGTNDNMVNIGFSRFTGNINGEVISNGVLQTSGFAATGVTQTNNNKFALVWGNGEFRFYVNGAKTSELSISNSPVGMDILRFAQGNGSQRTFLNNKQILVFPTALTDSECIALTTI